MTELTIENHVDLTPYNTLGIAAQAQRLVRIQQPEQLMQLCQQPQHLQQGWYVLGGGSNIVAAAQIQALVLKMEIMGRALVDETPEHWIIQAGAGENWHELVCWSVQQGWPGLENLALIPGVAGAAPVQNIGAYGIELQGRLHSVDAVDMHHGTRITLAAAQCGLAYRDSIFKHPAAAHPAATGRPDTQTPGGRHLVITHIRLALPKRWQAVTSYPDIQHTMQAWGVTQPNPQQILDMVVAIRQRKLTDPQQVGNAGSFFKNPLVSAAHYAELSKRYPQLPCYPMADGSYKLAAAALIEACGWRGKSMGNAGVSAKHALVLINRHTETGIRATGEEVLQLAQAIQHSVQARFGLTLEMEPVPFGMTG